MGNVKDMLNGMFSGYKNSAEYKDKLMMEIMFRREEFESNLDEMWLIYRRGCPQQIIEYQKGVDNIKKSGLKVLRNPAGKHKIIFKKE